MNVPRLIAVKAVKEKPVRTVDTLDRRHFLLSIEQLIKPKIVRCTNLSHSKSVIAWEKGVVSMADGRRGAMPHA
jgi:hypothetical protein